MTTYLHFLCFRCGVRFESQEIARECERCRVGGPVPFEMSGS
jgi:hypothetical protein